MQFCLIDLNIEENASNTSGRKTLWKVQTHTQKKHRHRETWKYFAFVIYRIQHLPEFKYFLKNFLEQNVSTCNWSIIHRLIENFKHRIKAGREAFLSSGSSKMSNTDLVAAPFKYTYFLMLPQGLLYNDGTWVRINEIPTPSTKSD